MNFQRSIITSGCILWLLLTKIYTQDTKDNLQHNENYYHQANLSHILQIPTFMENTLKKNDSINNHKDLQPVTNQTLSSLLNYKSSTSTAHKAYKLELVRKVQETLNEKSIKASETHPSSSIQKNIATGVLFQLDALQTVRPNSNSITGHRHQHKTYEVEGSKRHQKSSIECSDEYPKQLNQAKKSVYSLIKSTFDKVQHLIEIYLEIRDGYRQPRRKHTKFMKKFRKILIPLLLAYKLKFLTLIPLLIAGLVLLVGTTGLAGFFFALFAAVMTLKIAGSTHHDVMVKG